MATTVSKDAQSRYRYIYSIPIGCREGIKKRRRSGSSITSHMPKAATAAVCLMVAPVCCFCYFCQFTRTAGIAHWKKAKKLPWSINVNCLVARLAGCLRLEPEEEKGKREQLARDLHDTQPAATTKTTTTTTTTRTGKQWTSNEGGQKQSDKVCITMTAWKFFGQKPVHNRVQTNVG